MRSTALQRFEAALAGFPPTARDRLRRLTALAGMLPPGDVRALGTLMGLDNRELALALLPLAQTLALPEISGFRVGAVAAARWPFEAAAEGEAPPDGVALFLGANLEFPGLPLHHTVHAEQAAVANAWLRGATGLTALAVSAAPCGGCRQFLLEAVAEEGLTILLPAGDRGRQATALHDLLPDAFDPSALRQGGRLFDRPSPPPGDRGSSATLVQMAVAAAQRSYAPYTENLTGCGLRLADDMAFTGSSLENAAYNPGLTALQTALCAARLTGARLPEDIREVVLAERATRASQAAASEHLLATWAPAAQVRIHHF